ncbi:MAG: hypothetical protein ACOY31_09190 [Bacillota bacterium]
MPAALLMPAVMGLLRSEIQRGGSPAGVLSNVNRLL